MSAFLFGTEEEAGDKISIDELYERKRQQDLRQVSTFNKILNRVHNRITMTSRNKRDKFVWFVVPEYIFGDAVYSNAECIAYIITKLTNNGFFVKYIHPNTLFVSWESYIPNYVRNEFKKRTGKTVDEKGVVIDAPDDDVSEPGPAAGTNKTVGLPSSVAKESRQYPQTKQYRPTGNLVYNADIFEQIEKKIT